MTPPPCCAMTGIAVRQMRKGASTFTPMDRVQSASVVPSIVPRVMTPALFTMMSILPNASTAAAINPSQYSGFSKSPSKCASAKIALVSRSAAATRAPSARSPVTIACPMPPAAPVTNAVFPENRMICSLIIWNKPTAKEVGKTV